MIDSDNQSSGLKEVNREFLEIEKEGSKNIVPLPLAPKKAEESIALVKSGIKKVKTIPAGEYLIVIITSKCF